MIMGNRLIQDVPRREIVHVPWGASTGDIIRVLMEIANERDIEGQVKEFALKYKAREPKYQLELVRQLWAFCRSHIRYKADGWQEQAMQHPRRVYHTRQGDCKSMTLFVYACLSSIGVPCFIRFASYWSRRAVMEARERGENVSVGQIGHVYPVAIIDGREVPVDVCLEKFNAEQPAVRVLDKYTEAWPRQNIAAAIGSIERSPPRWVKLSIGFIALWQAGQMRGFPSLLSASVGGYYLYQGFKSQNIRR